MRDKRKDQYQIANDPFLNSLKSGSGDKGVPQYINIHKFLESRAHELKHFSRILSNKFTSKLEHQLLPKHMRRRAMAHNYYRIPLRIRFKSLLEMQPSEGDILSRSRCRKHRRKIKYLLNQYAMRQREHKWTESHIWHAKRFQMKDKWGYKIAYKSTDKSGRTVYRLCQRNSACIYDQSFMRSSLVEGNNAVQVISKLFNLKFNSTIVQDRDIQDDQGNLVCPVSILILSPQKLLVIYHPSTQQDVHEYFSKSSIILKNLDLNNFSILSQNISLMQLYNVLQPLAFDKDTEASLTLLPDLQFDQTKINDSQVLYFNLDREMINQSFKMNERIFNFELSAVCKENQINFQGRDLFYDHTQKKNIPKEVKKSDQMQIDTNSQQQNQQPQQQQKRINVREAKNAISQSNFVHKSFIKTKCVHSVAEQNDYYEQFIVQQQNLEKLKSLQEQLSQQVNMQGVKQKPIQFIGSQRTPFTHRKNKQRNKIKDLITRLKQAKEIHDIQRVERKEKLMKEHKEQVNQQLEKDSIQNQDVQMKDSNEADEKEYITVIVFKNKFHHQNNFGASFTILIPEGYGLNMLRRFVYSGCKPIGYKEFLAINLEIGNPVFPQDFCHTQVGKEQGVISLHEQMEHYCKRPSSKRINYQCLNFSSPFMPKIEEDQKYKFIKLFSLMRGVAQDGAMICLPNEQDLNQIAQILQNQKKSYQAFDLLENSNQTNAKNKFLNFEYCLMSGKNINLSKSDQNKIEKIRSGQLLYEMKILDNDGSFRFQCSNDDELKRQPIGYVTRGGYSQLRGKSIGIGLVQVQKLQEFKQDYERLNQSSKFLKGYILLIRNPNSLRYIPFVCYDKQ
eukprot:403342510